MLRPMEGDRYGMIGSILNHMNGALPEEYECVLAQFENPDGTFVDDIAIVRRDGKDLTEEEMQFLNIWTAQLTDAPIVTEEGVWVELDDKYDQVQTGFVKRRVKSKEEDNG